MQRHIPVISNYYKKMPWAVGSCKADLSIISAEERTFCVPKICYRSANHDIGLSCVQWRASNHQGRLPVDIAWSSCNSMQGLQGEGWGLRCSGQAYTKSVVDIDPNTRKKKYKR